MRRVGLISALALAVMAPACGPKTGGGDSGGGGDDGDTRGDSDTTRGDDTRGGDSGPDTDGDTGPDTGDTAGEDTGDDVDPDEIRGCYQCWEDNEAGQCAAVLEACWDSLACTQLLDCPFDCDGGAEACVQECNEIIPSGVDPLTAVMECMVCNDGPCWAECQNPFALAYCG